MPPGETESEEFVRGYPIKVLGSLSLGWAVLQSGRFVLSPLLPSIVADLAITAGQAGVAISLLQIAYAISQYPSGQWSDRLGRATIIVPSLLLLSVGFLTIGLSTTFVVFLLGAALVGIGKGLFASPSRTLLFDLFSEHSGRAIGIYTSGTDLGGLLAAGLAVVVLEIAVWRAAFLPISVTLLAVLGVYVYVNREPFTLEWPSGAKRPGRFRVLLDRDRRRVLVAYALLYMVVSGFITFFPLFLTATKGYSESLASVIFSTVFVVGLIVKPLAGGLSDRGDPTTVGSAGLAVAAMGLIGLQFVDSLVAVLAVLAIMAVGYKIQFPIADTIVMKSASAESMGADLGAARAGFLVVGSLGPMIVGTLATGFGYDVAFGALAACFLFASWSVFRAEI